MSVSPSSALSIANYSTPARVALGARAAGAPLHSVVRASRDSPTLFPADDAWAHARDLDPPRSLRLCPARRDRRSATTPGHDTQARRRRRRARARTRWCTVRAVPTTRTTRPRSTRRRPAPASSVRPPRRPSPIVHPPRPRARSHRIPSLPTRRRRRAASAPTPPLLRSASDPNRRSPPRTYLPCDTQARSSA